MLPEVSHHGFERKAWQKLFLGWCGLQGQAKGQVLVSGSGLFPPIEYQLPEGVSAEKTPTRLTFIIKGIDKQLVGR